MLVKKKQSKLTKFKPLILSRHPSHDILRHELPLMPFRSILRLGSTTTVQQAYSKRKVPLEASKLAEIIELNTVEAIKNSASKLLMKQKFTEAGVKTADWYISITSTLFVGKRLSDDGTDKEIEIEELPYPIVAKSHYGSRGVGNYKLDSKEELEVWLVGKNLNNYIFEKFSTFSKEYRIHVTDEGCFYTCRKLLKNDAPEGTWQLHDDGTVVWILEENPSFKKPNNWNLIVEDCIKAKNALGLDICSFDVMTQGSSKENPDWIIIESQSAPSFGELTAQKYIEIIPKVLINKYTKWLIAATQ